MGKSTKVTFTGLNHRGEGVARTAEGKIVFVPYALPGEEALIQVKEEKKTWSRGELGEILYPSPYRLEPPCPVFHSCGGCSLQHFDYEQQLLWKQQKVKEGLRRLGGLAEISVLPTMASPRIYGYRNKITLHWEQRRGEALLGYYPTKTHRLVTFQRCLLVSDYLNETMNVLKELLVNDNLPDMAAGNQVVLRQSFYSNEVMVVIGAPDFLTEMLQEIARKLQERLPYLASVWQQIIPVPGKGRPGKTWLKLLAGKDKIKEKLWHKDFYLGPGTFLQVNSFQAEILYKKVLELLQDKAPISCLADLYCGAGTLTLLAADCAAKVIGVDSFAPAIEDARLNARINNIENASFFTGSSEILLPRLLAGQNPPQAVLLDPPRQGCSQKLLQTISESHIPFLVYVSCDSATLSRDLKYLASQNYQPGPVQPVDMFPQTSHIETVVWLHRKHS
ncbi:MAG: 23S rRNA (uracil(1939)-C(5))-methyltransferase RlmD [Dethiobacter sp.]|nr:MAG: 23S rRNA (uracil(1939)-C(5))-methyltransferase RlmD [Dethiobacter sp.]